ncbi:hypothetical protein [Mycobacterium heidelbergense]|uniref:hypothetical protein n=1 Tax=Mycobacterium heidelbergense TaxID=53376 RepID=UPI00114DF89A|nr:hypothetical protein [Mycobacterium heidelbergense]BBZ52654.1 hypothetical protein MHEI_43710 [Mycobacterium heidelbergense]
MDLAARPQITAGVALASAAVIAAGPMAQHLPDLHLTQQLRHVSVSEINLTDAAASAIDLFSGVENELASLAGGSVAAGVPAASISVNPVQTWISAFQTAATNFQTIYNKWSAIPFPLLQQVVANDVGYANYYLNAYQRAANGVLTYFTSTTGINHFFPALVGGVADFQAGNITGGINAFYDAFYDFPVSQILEPLENILRIPSYMATNLSNALNYLTTTGLTYFGLSALIGLPGVIETALAKGMQTAYTSWASGDYLNGVLNLLNVPGLMANAALNAGGGGVFGSGFGVLNTLGVTIPGAVTKDIVSPVAGTPNILAGGSLSAQIQAFANNLVTGWPSLQTVVGDVSNLVNNYLLPIVRGSLSNLPSVFSNIAGTITTQVGAWISAILRLL